MDLGNFASNRAKVDEMTSRFIWDTMVDMGVDAFSPGPRELQYWNLLEDFMAEGAIPVVSSNLTYLDNGEEKPVGQRYLILERNGVKVALMALMGGSQFSTARIPSDVQVVFADPFQTAQELVPELQKQADLVVLMSQMTTPDTNRLIQEVPGIDAALYGNLAPWVDRASQVGETVINQTGTRGQYLGHLVMIVDPDGKLIDWGSKNVQMAENIPEDEAFAAKVAEHEEEVKKVQTGAPGESGESEEDADGHEGHSHPGE